LIIAQFLLGTLVGPVRMIPIDHDPLAVPKRNFHHNPYEEADHDQPERGNRKDCDGLQMR
jgi:hypothetical protein